MEFVTVSTASLVKAIAELWPFTQFEGNTVGMANIKTE